MNLNKNSFRHKTKIKKDELSHRSYSSYQRSFIFIICCVAIYLNIWPDIYIVTCVNLLGGDLNVFDAKIFDILRSIGAL